MHARLPACLTARCARSQQQRNSRRIQNIYCKNHWSGTITRRGRHRAGRKSRNVRDACPSARMHFRLPVLSVCDAALLAWARTPRGACLARWTSDTVLVYFGYCIATGLAPGSLAGRVTSHESVSGVACCSLTRIYVRVQTLARSDFHFRWL